MKHRRGHHVPPSGSHSRSIPKIWNGMSNPLENHHFGKRNDPQKEFFNFDPHTTPYLETLSSGKRRCNPKPSFARLLTAKYNFHTYTAC